MEVFYYYYYYDYYRLRGRPAVFHSIYLEVAGWNLLRASKSAQWQQKVLRALAARQFGQFGILFRRIIRPWSRFAAKAAPISQGRIPGNIPGSVRSGKSQRVSTLSTGPCSRKAR